MQKNVITQLFELYQIVSAFINDIDLRNTCKETIKNSNKNTATYNNAFLLLDTVNKAITQDIEFIKKLTKKINENPETDLLFNLLYFDKYYQQLRKDLADTMNKWKTGKKLDDAIKAYMTILDNELNEKL